MPFQKLYLIRDHLDHLPNFPLPVGFSVRWYQPGDEAHWLAIHRLADEYNDITPDLFERQFGGNRQELPRRQCYLLDATGNPVGTGTAWFNDNWEGRGPYGRVHWLAVLPAHQGLGLGKALMTFVCQRLRELGHQRAYLSTIAARVEALGLYQQFGFRPLVGE